MNREEYIRAAKAQILVIDDPESSDYGRHLIHCRGRFTGADWDLEQVIAEIESADDVWWDTDSLFSHQLKCRTGDIIWSFEVSKPEENLW